MTQLPPGFSANFVGQSFQERAAQAQVPILYAVSLTFVFLLLAAMYESWSIPVVILLAVPLGIVGAVLATALRGMESDLYFRVALLTTMGLTCKNAILIAEFARRYAETGLSLTDATLLAVRRRLRPIVMTSVAFGIGVFPLAVATGAGAGAQRAIGTGVLGGVFTGTLLGIFFVPLLFVLVRRPFTAARTLIRSSGTPRTSLSLSDKHLA